MGPITRRFVRLRTRQHYRARLDIHLPLIVHFTRLQSLIPDASNDQSLQKLQPAGPLPMQHTSGLSCLALYLVFLCNQHVASSNGTPSRPSILSTIPTCFGQLSLFNARGNAVPQASPTTCHTATSSTRRALSRRTSRLAPPGSPPHRIRSYNPTGAMEQIQANSTHQLFPSSRPRYGPDR